jgi:hypothetical protein
MARHDPPFDIRGSAGSEVDEKSYVFPLVKWRVRGLGRDNKSDDTKDR